MSELYFQIHGLTETRARKLRKIAQSTVVAQPFLFVFVIGGFLTTYHYASTPDLSGLWKYESQNPFSPKEGVVRIHQSMDRIVSSYTTSHL